MPLGPGVNYAYRPGTKIRLAFKDGKVIEAKNMATGVTHTPAEFEADRALRAKHKKGAVSEALRKKFHGS